MKRRKQSLSEFPIAAEVAPIEVESAVETGAEADNAIDVEPDGDLDISQPDIETGPEGIFEAEALPKPETSSTSRRARPEEPLSAVMTELKATTVAEPRSPNLPAARKTPVSTTVGGGRRVYALAAIASLTWLALLGAFFGGYVYDVAPFTLKPVALTVAGIIATGVVITFWVLAYAAAQGSRLASEAKLARRQAEDMVRPAALAAHDTGQAVELIKVEIESAVSAAAQARHELTTLRDVLSTETARLVDAAASSARTAAALTQSISDERKALETLTLSLERQVVATEEAIARQARMVAEASDLAETQIREAEAALTARAGDLAAAASEASEAARAAGEDRSRQAIRLETAGTFVTDQVRSAEDSLADQRAAIVSVSHQLRKEQEGFAAQVEGQQAQLSEILDQLRHDASELSANTQASGQSLRDLVSVTAEQFREVAEAAAEERDLFGASTLKSIGALSEAARHERETFGDEAQKTIEALARSAAEARDATASQAESARLKIEQLGDAAFSAGQKADATFEARLNEARALIEQSANLVEEAGQRASTRLVEGLDAAKSTVSQLEALLSELDSRTTNLPAEALARSDEVKAAVAQGVEDLLDTARKAAEETQAIDAAFQERVRRNYEMLSEAVRLMGAVGGAAPARPVRTPAPRVAEPIPAPAPVAAPDSDRDEAGGRSRLRLTPTAGDADPAAPAEPAKVEAAPVAGPAARGKIKGDDDGWTWRELLSSIDGEPGEAPTAKGGLIAEIGLLGIDPDALLPQSRIDEIAPILQTGDHHGAREIVRRLAPVALRRLTRSLSTDASMRLEAAALTEKFEALLDEAARKDRQGFAIAVLLATGEGRAWLLIDAASEGA